MNLKERIMQPVNKVVEREGFELIELTVAERGHKALVRVFADRPAALGGGISIEECARLSGKLADYFDLENVFERSYILEVSSPGLDRTLTSRRDFEWKVGRPVRLWLNASNGTVEAAGLLAAVTEEGVRLQSGGEEKFFPFTEVVRGKEII